MTDTQAIDVVAFDLRVLVFAALSAATLIIKWITLIMIKVCEVKI